ncbi:transposable element Tcb1 transposase [Trichonephila clavipes]|nr:transposable element Tcb1 transposase [Trichonephila clavipes]
MLQHTGRLRVTTLNEDRYIYLAVTAKRNRRSTASDLSRQLSSATGTTVSRQTVYRRLRYIGLYACRPVRCVPLTATHCRLRLTWSREHALWTPQQWSCMMFSDQSRALKNMSNVDCVSLFRDFPEVINSIVVVKIPNPTDISLDIAKEEADAKNMNDFQVCLQGILDKLFEE